MCYAIRIIVIDNKISISKNICRDSLYQGHLFIKDVLQRYAIRCHDLFRMEKHVFIKLCDLLDGECIFSSFFHKELL